MQIRVGYELIYDCPQPTPMMLMLNIHYTRASDLVIPDHLTTCPSQNSYPRVAMMQPRQNGRSDNGPISLDRST